MNDSSWCSAVCGIKDIAPLLLTLWNSSGFLESFYDFLHCEWKKFANLVQSCFEEDHFQTVQWFSVTFVDWSGILCPSFVLKDSVFSCCFWTKPLLQAPVDVAIIIIIVIINITSSCRSSSISIIYCLHTAVLKGRPLHLLVNWWKRSHSQPVVVESWVKSKHAKWTWKRSRIISLKKDESKGISWKWFTLVWKMSNSNVKHLWLDMSWLKHALPATVRLWTSCADSLFPMWAGVRDRWSKSWLWFPQEVFEELPRPWDIFPLRNNPFTTVKHLSIKWSG